MTQEKFQALYDEYKDQITDISDEEVKKLKFFFDELNSISQNNDVLLVTVVGSVKAGKSTFFNCLINESQDITETDTKECTIRPSFVFPGSKFSFNTYERTSSDENSNININNLLNYFIEGKDKFIADELKCKTKDDKGKMADYVRECQDPSRNFLFTSFSIDNQKSTFVKQLKGKKVVFVDMPGNDGKTAEDKLDPFYETILKRTDLVLFICSSSNEISASLDKYLNFIKENNKKVPFILVLNYRDEKATQPTEEQQNEQLEYFANKLENNKFIVIKKTIQNAHYAHTMRFGEPCDEYKKVIVAEYAKKFDDFEKDLYSNFFDQNTIHQRIEENRDNRFKSQFDPFVEALTNTIAIIQKDEDDFEKLEKYFEFSKDKLYQDLSGKRNEIEKKDDKETNAKSDSNVISDIKIGCTTKGWFWKPKFRKYVESRLKERIIKEEVQPFIDKQIKNYKEKLKESIKEKYETTEVVVEESSPNFLNEDSEKKGEDKLLCKKFYNTAINNSVYYNLDDLERALVNLRNKLFTFERIGTLIVNACKDLKKEVVDKLRKERRIEGRKELLATLKDLKNQLMN